MTRCVRGLAAPVLVLMMAAAAAAAPARTAAPPESVAGAPQPTYGTGSLTTFIIAAAAFVPDESATTYSSTGSGRYLTNSGAFVAGPMLPNGSQIEAVTLRACDTNPAPFADVTVLVGSCPSTTGCGIDLILDTTGSPGCDDFTLPISNPLIVNNDWPLYVEVRTGLTATTTFSAVKLHYRLRISPAPATATFPSDVPTTHPFFRFVEALAAAGVTGGCGTGSYCPDAPVTRGQMAVFLATALGLHFPN